MKTKRVGKTAPNLDPITESFVAGISAAADAFAVAWLRGSYDVTHPWCHATASRNGNKITIEIKLER